MLPYDAGAERFHAKMTPAAAVFLSRSKGESAHPWFVCGHFARQVVCERAEPKYGSWKCLSMAYPAGGKAGDAHRSLFRPFPTGCQLSKSDAVSLRHRRFPICHYDKVDLAPCWPSSKRKQAAGESSG